VYWESFDDVRKAITREKQLKLAQREEAMADRQDKSKAQRPSRRLV
jgi:hypothetical protein